MIYLVLSILAGATFAICLCAGLKPKASIPIEDDLKSAIVRAESFNKAFADSPFKIGMRYIGEEARCKEMTARPIADGVWLVQAKFTKTTQVSTPFLVGFYNHISEPPSAQSSQNLGYTPGLHLLGRFLEWLRA